MRDRCMAVSLPGTSPEIIPVQQALFTAERVVDTLVHILVRLVMSLLHETYPERFNNQPVKIV